MVGRVLLRCALMALTLGSWPAAAANVVVIDAGHGGGDRGGIPRQRVAEKEWTLKTALRLSGELKQRGFDVVMTRTSDEFISLSERCRIANSRKDAIFVSVHYDAYRREAADGVTTYYTGSRSEKLAQLVHKRVVGAVKPETNRGYKRARFYVLRNTLCPAVLVEGGFLTNGRESRKIQTAEYQQALAAAIADGVAEYRKYRTGR